MAPIHLNVPLLRDGNPSEFEPYFNQLRQHHSAMDICQSLFLAIDKELLRADIFSVFLPWSRSLDAIALCIHEGPVSRIRTQGIKDFGKALADPEQWKPAWATVGGTERLMAFCAKSSVAEVKALAREIGRCNRGHEGVPAREKVIDELVRALLPSHYPDSIFRTHDKRPIQDYYAQMAPACSRDFVSQLLDARDPSNPLYRLVSARSWLKTHGELLQHRVIAAIFADGCVDELLPRYLEAFVYSQPPRSTSDPRISASMAFAWEVLQRRLHTIHNNRWPSTISEVDILFSLLHRSLRKRLPKARIHDIFKLALQLLEAKPELESRFQSGQLWSYLLACWRRAPKFYEDLLILALQSGLAGTQKTIGFAYLKTSRVTHLQFRPELRWPLLRLYCLHVPKKGIDLDTATDFRVISEQPWSTDTFAELDKDQAVRLLKGLHSANPQYSFLQGPGTGSILSTQELMSQHNFNVPLLLTLLQRQSGETQSRAEIAVNDYRMKSATTKDQSDRAQLAKAASTFAIASGDLELYAKTVIWQQRYVRDPLTVKVVFGYDAVTTREGIDLLSGIQQPLPRNITMAEVTSEVEKSNGVLMTFHDTMLMAKREPSFHQPDWVGVASLFGATIRRRVDHSKDIQKHLQDSETEIYTAIWAGTLAMLEKVDIAFLNQAYGPIKSILVTLPPTALATATRAMLGTDNEKRENHDRRPADNILERLSYEVLLQLAESEKPELAQELILRTILDRPDASSWHRKLLSTRLMNSLSANDAQKMLLTFATAIGEKLEDQSHVRFGEAQATKSPPPQSFVKVTTVKYLAQLLDKAEFISADAAAEILVELFKAGTHRDVRLATLESLLSLLSNICNGAEDTWNANPLVEKVMGALETIVPVVGGINERHSTRTEDWEESKTTGVLPEIADMPAGIPPLMETIIYAPHSPLYPGLQSLQSDFVARLFLPILERSLSEHRKWITLFLAKYKASITVDDVPPTPITMRLWVTIISYHPTLVPQTVFEDFNKYLIMTISPHIVTKQFSDSLINNADLSNTPEVLHWLSMFNKSMSHYANSGTQMLVNMIHHSQLHSSISNGVTFSKVIDMIVSQASLFLEDYECYTDFWNDFTEDLQPPMKTRFPHEDAHSIRKMYSAWHTTGRVLLDNILSLVSDKSKQFAREHNRRVLPSTTQLRLSLLPYPCFPDPIDVDSQCTLFVKELVQVLDVLLSGETNVLRWSHISKSTLGISRLLNTPEDRLHVALYVGELAETRTQNSSALNYIRIGLAIKLIEDGQDFLNRTDMKVNTQQRDENGIVYRLRKRVEEWGTHHDEEVRESVTNWRREKKGLWDKIMYDD